MKHCLAAFVHGLVTLAMAPASFAQCDPIWLSGELTAGINNEVRKLTPWNGGLIALGTFTQVGAAPANGIAFWNNSTWSPIGSSISGSVLDAVDFNGTLFIGGAFSAGSAHRIARLSGSNWVPAGVDLNGTVNALAIHNGELYAAGTFTQAGSTSASRIAKWNGTSWAPVGSGLPATVYDLVSFNGNLIACGAFTTAGGLPAPGIAQWNGTAWSPIPDAAFPVAPYEIAVIGSDLLVTGYAAGHGFLHAYDGATWRNEVETHWFTLAGFAHYADSLYIGGDNTLITETRGDWARSQPLFTSPGYTIIYCMAEHRGVLFIGGYFTGAGGNPASMIARYYIPTADFNHDKDFGTDADIEAFFACLAGNCCSTCGSADFNGDGSSGTDEDIESFFRILSGGCA